MSEQRSENRNDDESELETFDELYVAIYAELKRLAASVIRKDRLGRLIVTPTTLVHEAWMKLRRSPKLAGLERLHFFSIAARAMRQVLMDIARRRLAAKRAGDVITFNEDVIASRWSLETYLTLESALTDLTASKPQLAQVFEMHFFVGLTHAEIGETLGVTERQARRLWTEARLRLMQQMKAR